jgi:hypothetical protein
MGDTKIYYLELFRASEGMLSRWSRLHLQSLAPTNPYWARVVVCGPFSLCVIHKECLCPSSRDINGLMTMMTLCVSSSDTWQGQVGCERESSTVVQAVREGAHDAQVHVARGRVFALDQQIPVKVVAHHAVPARALDQERREAQTLLRLVRLATKTIQYSVYSIKVCPTIK